MSGPTQAFVDEAKKCLEGGLRLVDPPKKIQVRYRPVGQAPDREEIADAWALLELGSDLLVVELETMDGGLPCAKALLQPDGHWHIHFRDASPFYIVDAL